MTAQNAILWALDVLVAIWAWPYYERAHQHRPRVIWFWLSVCLLPVASWFWLVPMGFIGRARRAERGRELRAAELAEERRQAVAFLRDQLQTGTLLEQLNAREMLQLWGVPERDESWLVVNGPPRRHAWKPSETSYGNGCRCEPCAQAYRQAAARRKRAADETPEDEPNGIAAAVQHIRRQILTSFTIPSVVLDSPADCPDCDVDEVQVRNAAAQVVVTHITGVMCPAHGGEKLDLAIPRIDTPHSKG